MIPRTGRLLARLVAFGNLAQHLVEVGRLAEVAIDRGEAHVGHGI